MTTCTSCGNDVTGKKFCQQCGTPVQQAANTGQHAPTANTCPQCNGEVKPGAAFCMHCGASLSAPVTAATAPSAQSAKHTCPACHSEVPVQNAFCTNCGQSMNAPAPAPQPVQSFCTSCGRQNDPGTKFCAACGSPLTTGTQAPMAQPAYMQSGQYPPQQSQYGQPPYAQPYGQPPYTQQPYSQPYGQPPYAQGQMGYQPQPMMGQGPMVLRCPVCMAMSPMGTPNCPSCHTSLAGVVPTPANMPAQGQQGGLGGFMQGDGGKYAMGALGGAAAVVGGEMLLHGLEHHHEHGYDRDEGMLGGLGEIAGDLGLF